MTERLTKHPGTRAIVKAFNSTCGVLQDAAEKLKINRATLSKWIKADPALKEALETAREEALDLAESKLFELMEDGNLTAIIFFLKCKGKKRGYVERTKVKTIEAVEFEIKEVD